MTITTVMPVKNGERYIADAIRSLQHQTRLPDRVVVIDNCSTDKTREICGKYHWLEYRRNLSDYGLFHNHNIGLKLASETDYFHFLHHDDLLEPSFIFTMTEALRHLPHQGVAYCQATTIDQNGDEIRPIVRQRAGPTRVIKADAFAKDRARLKADIFTSGVMLKTDRKPTPYDFTERFKQMSDQFFWAQLVFSWLQAIKVNQKLIRFRQHNQSQSEANLLDFDAIVSDFEVSQEIESWRGQTGLSALYRRHYLKIFWAGLSQTKMANAGALKHKVETEVRKIIPILHWKVGEFAYKIREIYRQLL